MTPHHELFNAVILPVTAPEAALPLFQVSATRNDRLLRLLSPHWSEPELRAAFGSLATPTLHIEQLLRGNRMVSGGRETRKLFFTAEQLLAIGLLAEPSGEQEPALLS